MNVIKFNIELSKGKQNNNNKSIKNQIINFYENNNEDAQVYLNNVKEKWSNTNFTPEGLSSLYKSDWLIASTIIEGDNYFIFDTNDNGNKNKISLDVLIIMQSSFDINHSLNVVINDIKNVNMIHIDLNVLRKHDVYMYPSNKEKSDILDPDYKIKSQFEPKINIKTPETFRIIAIIILTLICLILYTVDSIPDAIQNLAGGIGASSILFIITEVLVQQPWKYKIAINNLTNFVEDTRSLPYTDDSSTNELENPVIEEEGA